MRLTILFCRLPALCRRLIIADLWILLRIYEQGSFIWLGHKFYIGCKMLTVIGYELLVINIEKLNRN